MTPKQVWAFLSCAIACSAGCGAAVPPPNDEWAAAQTDVGRAEAGGAASVPDAKLHLQQALEDLQKSKQEMGENNKRAASLCALARAEAQLAMSLAKQAIAENGARQAIGDSQKATQ
jgi:hypothetical protein